MRPITLVVGFAAGGPNDTIARILAERMQLSLGQPIIVEDVAGVAAAYQKSEIETWRPIVRSAHISVQ
jgi:hypothetical protein